MACGFKRFIVSFAPTQMRVLMECSYYLFRSRYRAERFVVLTFLFSMR